MESGLFDLIKPNQVFVFSGTYCPYCDRAKASLKKLGVAFLHREIDLEPLSKSDEIKLDELSGFDTIPKIFVGKKCIGGNSDLQELIKSGEIYNILEAEKIAYTKL